jgi:hypothetical protein
VLIQLYPVRQDQRVTPERKVIRARRVRLETTEYKGQKARKVRTDRKAYPAMIQPYRDQRVPKVIPVRRVKLEIPD